MPLDIINPDFVTETVDKHGIIHLKLRDNRHKLGDVLNFLPHGIIDKTVTGIGATTLEINAKRNSIIVVPLKIIAASKAKQHPENCFYVGSAIGEIKKFDKEQFDSFLSNKNIRYKKIIVVAESLSRVINTIGNTVYDDYFFMIDEVNSIQESSTYRETIENCLDFYLKFPKESRAMVTATMIQFSNPNLLQERKIVITHDSIIERNIDELLICENALGVCVDLILKELKKSENDKVVIAHNSVVGSRLLADKLSHLNPELEAQISILCSKSNKTNAGAYYAELDDLTYPSKINFITSAYFSGYDIQEKYHLIHLSNGKEINTVLSTNSIKQIAGRGRKGLLSEKIIYSLVNINEIEKITTERLLKLAEAEIKSIICINNNFKEHGFFKDTLLEIQNAVIEKGGYKGYKLIREDIDKKVTVSYFNIDAFMEHQRIRIDEHGDVAFFIGALTKDASLKYANYIASKHVFTQNPTDASLNLKENINAAISALREMQDESKLYYLLKSAPNKTQKIIFDRYDKLYKFYGQKELLLDKLADLSEMDSRAFDNFKNEVVYKSTPEDHAFKRNIRHLFNIGTVYNSQEMLELFNKAYALSGIGAKNDKQLLSKTTSAVTTFKSFFKYERKQYEKGYKLLAYTKKEDYLEDIITRDENNPFMFI